ncbi:MAG: hypothetical protein CL678_04005, partial [Bdellovibrionaceae bacterium]|nr:hypothetical protein [Pseudobdellovibrionaceae bacterium]
RAIQSSGTAECANGRNPARLEAQQRPMPCGRKFIAHARYTPNATSPPFMRLALRRGRATLFYCVHGNASIFIPVAVDSALAFT